MDKVYMIVTYDLIGKKLFACKEMPNLEMKLDNNRKPKYYDKESGLEYPKSHLWELSTTPKKDAIDPDREQLMPYLADVTEDLPSSCKWKPFTWEKCQLMVEKHGGYLQFFHHSSGEVLRIAMNSHYYTPIK